MATAGRSIAFSGLTVAAGLLVLVVVPVPLVRSIGLGGMLIPAASVAVTLTLLPVLLAAAGQRLDWPRRSRPARLSQAWAGWARRVVRRKWAAAAAALAILRTLEDAGVPAGVLDPIEVLVPATANPPQLAHRLAALPGVRAAAAPGGPAWRRGGTALVSVQPAAPASTAAGTATITAVRHLDAAIPGAQAGGPGALLLDENHAFYSQFPLLIAILAVITVALLARAFGSLLLPGQGGPAQPALGRRHLRGHCPGLARRPRF